MREEQGGCKFFNHSTTKFGACGLNQSGWFIGQGALGTHMNAGGFKLALLPALYEIGLYSEESGSKQKSGRGQNECRYSHSPSPKNAPPAAPASMAAAPNHATATVRREIMAIEKRDGVEVEKDGDRQKLREKVRERERERERKRERRRSEGASEQGREGGRRN